MMGAILEVAKDGFGEEEPLAGGSNATTLRPNRSYL
jgi:hypothetical protein